MLRNTDDDSMNTLLIDKIWKSGDVPTEWKKPSYILILRQGKPPSLENLRPISVTSCVVNVAEHAAFNRLSRYMEEHEVCPHAMVGFRLGRGNAPTHAPNIQLED